MDFNKLADFFKSLGYEIEVNVDNESLFKVWILDKNQIDSDPVYAFNIFGKSLIEDNYDYRDTFTPKTFDEDLEFVNEYYENPYIYDNFRNRWIKFPKDELEMEIEKIIEGVD